MNRSAFFVGMAAALAIMACNRGPENRFLDLNTGKPVELRTDSATGYQVDAVSGKPVDVYVDTKSHDTIYGRTGKVVNGHVIRTDNGHWVVKNDGEEYKAVSGEAKIKSEGDESKVKDGDYTRKVDKNGDVKVETGSKTIKVDGKTGERKVKKDHNITDKVKKILR
jgi:hypothetical protein